MHRGIHVLLLATVYVYDWGSFLLNLNTQMSTHHTHEFECRLVLLSIMEQATCMHISENTIKDERKAGTLLFAMLLPCTGVEGGQHCETLKDLETLRRF